MTDHFKEPLPPKGYSWKDFEKDDHFKEPLPPGVKNLDDFEIHFPNAVETILSEVTDSPQFSISITYEERNAFKNYVNSVRDFHGNEAFGGDPLIESLIDKICHPEVSK